MVKVDIYSDTICPWCYIGKSLFDGAGKVYPDVQLDIEWHPYQLNPDMPDGGMDRSLYLERKFGGPERAKSVYGRIEDAAKGAGLSANLHLIRKTPNTVNSHRLIHWARIEGVQNEAVDRLFDAYFNKGEDIGDTSALAKIAGDSGMDKTAVEKLLEGDADKDLIIQRSQKARSMGMQGVPCFIIAGKYAVTGAQPTSMWTGVLKELAQEKARLNEKDTTRLH